MTIIKIAYEVPAEAVARVESALEDVALRDPNWNGAEFSVERDDFTCVETSDELAGTSLLHSVIYPAIRGE